MWAWLATPFRYLSLSLKDWQILIAGLYVAGKQVLKVRKQFLSNLRHANFAP